MSERVRLRVGVQEHWGERVCVVGGWGSGQVGGVCRRGEKHTGNSDARGAGRGDDYAGRGDVTRRPQRGADSGPLFPF